MASMIGWGAVVGALAWLQSQRRAKVRGQASAALPTYLGLPIGAVAAALAFVCAGAGEGAWYAPLAALFGVMLVTDIAEQWVYDPLPLAALLWALVVAAHDGVFGAHALAAVAYGAGGLAFVLWTNAGLADAYAAPIFGALFGWWAWPVVAFSLLVTALLVPLRRRFVDGVPGYVGHTIALFIGFAGIVPRMEAFFFA